MDRNEYDQADREVIALVNSNAAKIKERNARLRDGQAPVEYVQGPYYWEEAAEKQVRRILPAMGRGCVGLAFVAGLVNGLCEVEFAVAGLVVSVLWGIVNYWRSGHA